MLCIYVHQFLKIFAEGLPNEVDGKLCFVERTDWERIMLAFYEVPLWAKSTIKISE